MDNLGSHKGAAVRGGGREPVLAAAPARRLSTEFDHARDAHGALDRPLALFNSSEEVSAQKGVVFHFAPTRTERALGQLTSSRVPT
jgi:hypothetical protein